MIQYKQMGQLLYIPSVAKSLSEIYNIGKYVVCVSDLPEEFMVEVENL